MTKLKLVSEYAEKCKNMPNTTEDIVRYLNEHEPTGAYVSVIRVFQGKKSRDDHDLEFYKWLQLHYKELECLKPLKEQEGFREFIFEFGKMDPPIYNQKWHFYVSYLAYREYATYLAEKGISIPGVTPFHRENGELKTGALRFLCPELRMWYQSVEA